MLHTSVSLPVCSSLAMSVAAALSALERSKAQFEAEKAAGAALRQQKLIDVRNNPLHSRMRSHLAHTADEQIQRTFTTLHCTHCTHYAAILSASLSALPRRLTDSAHILQTERHMFKLKLDRGSVVALRRERGVEKQWRWNCRQCGLPVAYQCEPPPDREEGDRGRRKGAVGDGTEVKAVKEERKEKEEEEVNEQWPAIIYLMKGALTTADEQLERESHQQPTEASREGRAEGAADEKRTAEELEIERAIAELTRRDEIEEQEGKQQAERMTTHTSTAPALT